MPPPGGSTLSTGRMPVPWVGTGVRRDSVRRKTKPEAQVSIPWSSAESSRLRSPPVRAVQFVAANHWNLRSPPGNRESAAWRMGPAPRDRHLRTRGPAPV